MSNERIYRCRDIARMREVFVQAWNMARQFTDPFEIVLRPIKAKRSADQNRRYWALLREVAATVWVMVDGKQRQFSDETWHEHFKRELIGREEIVLPNGETEVRGISTTILSVEDMGNYMNMIEAFCNDQGYPVMEAAA